MTEVISVVNLKGGVGKTTLAVNLAYNLAKNNPSDKVLLIDLDPQMNATSYLMKEEERDKLLDTPNDSILPLFDTSINPNDICIPIKQLSKSNLYFIPGHLNLTYQSNSDLYLSLKNYLNNENFKIKDTFKFIFIDIPPTVTFFLDCGLAASTGYIIPTTLSNLSTLGITLLHNYIDSILPNRANCCLKKYGIVVTQAPSKGTTIYKKMMPKMKSEFKIDLFPNDCIIPYTVSAINMLHQPNPEKRMFFNAPASNSLKISMDAISKEFSNRLK